MEQLSTYSDRFVKNLFNFISDIARYSNDKDCKTFIDIYEKLDMNKLLLRFVNIISKNETKLQNKDVTLFETNIIPGINFSNIWPTLTDLQQNKCWTHLQILYLNANIVVKNTQSSNNNTNNNNNTLEFDPYVGIGGGDNTEYSINDIMEGPKNLELDDLATPGLESIIKVFGVDKMIDLDKLKEQLENMTDEDINEQTENIKKLLGANLDERTSELISGMLGNIKDKLKDTDIKKGNPFEFATDVAKKVSEDLKRNISQSDMEHLFNSINMSNKSGFNPMSIFSKININDKKGLENLMKNPAALQKLVEDAEKEAEEKAKMNSKEKLRQNIKNKSALRRSRR